MILRHKIYPKNYVNLLHSISHHRQKYQHIPRSISVLFADIGNGASGYRKGLSVNMNCSPSSRQLKKYKFFLPAEIYLLAVFMQLASKFHVFPLVLKFQDSFANVCCCSNLYNLRSFLREYFYQ